MHWRIQLVIVCLLLTASLAALWTAVKRNRLAEVQVVLTNVESLRSAVSAWTTKTSTRCGPICPRGCASIC